MYVMKMINIVLGHFCGKFITYLETKLSCGEWRVVWRRYQTYFISEHKLCYFLVIFKGAARLCSKKIWIWRELTGSPLTCEIQVVQHKYDFWVRVFFALATGCEALCSIKTAIFLKFYSICILVIHSNRWKHDSQNCIIITIILLFFQNISNLKACLP